MKMSSPVVACQFVLYTNDGVTVTYTDNSRLQLSPCGATLVHVSAPEEGHHPLHGEITVFSIHDISAYMIFINIHDIVEYLFLHLIYK